MRSGVRLFGLVVLLTTVLTGCITTTISPYDDKKDLEKAEQTYIQIGYDYFQKGNMLEAKKALTRALDLNSRSSGAHLGLARVFERELEYDLADDHFGKALRYSDDTEIMFQYGVYLYNRGEYKDSYRQFRDVLKDTLYVRRAQAFEYQAVVSARLAKTEEAIEYYQRAIALNKMMSNSYLGLARIYHNRDDYRLAYNYYTGFLDLVRSQLSRHNAASLWLGIQLASELGDANVLSSLELQLRNRFSDSNEYQLYQAWKAEQDAA
ncbi:type IV pilus biogenesis/stability protein PilW [Reinekea blandensis]|uniref:Type IV pilus biogenesis protein PilF n=1 Tax=Reinekea blandensis MED297 TaxID=314283 RepID=A4BH39_9GAMM|nr:type IV pilus biogenesis/stability protein PilW [Reinekea blandensis]EAR08538.1 type IV pilus biogenesis protein PilF [Reinekea sp. MED297] [Reinekea blandensis MED297]